MNPEYDPSAKIEVIYDDKISLATSYDVEILVVKHLEQNCLEVFAYDPHIDKESNRLYVNSKKVRSKLNRKDVEERASFLRMEEVSQEVYLEHLNQVTSDLAVEFILNRIHLDSEALSSSRCVLFLSSSERDSNDPVMARLASNDIPVFQYVVKPEGVTPFVLGRSRDETNEDDPDSSADEFNSEDNKHSRPSFPESPDSGGDGMKSKLQCLSQKKSFSCCNDINILWEEKEEVGGILSISEIINRSNNSAELSTSSGDPLSNSSGEKSRSNSKPHIEPPVISSTSAAPRRSSFDSVVQNLASRVLAPLFPESSSGGASGAGASGSRTSAVGGPHADVIANCNKLDAGVTPKRRSTFSIFTTAKPRAMHGENYTKTSMKLAPLEQVPTTPTATSTSASNGGSAGKTLTTNVVTPQSAKIFGSSSTIGNSRSGSEATMDLPVSPTSVKSSPMTPVVGARKGISKKKLSHHHIKNYL